MRIMLCTDIHADQQSLASITSKAAGCDALLCAGDISIFGARLDDSLQALDSIGIPVCLIPGNHEDENALAEHTAAYPNITTVHGSAHLIDNLLVIGHGGGGFGQRSLDFSPISPQLRTYIQTHRTSTDAAKVAMLIHQPPYGTALDDVPCAPAGCLDYREFIEQHQPDLVICGHIHENAGKRDRIDKSVIINPGPRGEVMEL